MQTTSVKNITNDYGEWKTALEFYKDELGIFNNRLTEIAKKNTARETMQMVEHFHNQFLIQAENADTLKHDINEHLNFMAKEMQVHAGHVSKGQLSVQGLLKERFENMQSVFNVIKDEFSRFLSKVM